jgi:hypothetical protein
MSPVDEKLDATAAKLDQRSEEWAAQGGVKAKVAGELAEDADLLRKIKPSLMKARAKGDLPKDGGPGQPRSAPSGPQLGKRAKKPHGSGGGGPSPWLVLGGAFVAGIFLAKWLDWRGHAHPKH